MQADIERARREAHDYLDRLPALQLAAVRGLLEAMVIPSFAPDDEPIADEDRTRVHEGRAWLAAHGGRGIAMEEVLADFGVSPEELSPKD